MLEAFTGSEWKINGIMLRLKVEEAYQNVARVPRSRGFVDHGRGGGGGGGRILKAPRRTKELSRKGCRRSFQYLSGFKQMRISRSRRNVATGRAEKV
jgi:hypothetical protein